MWLIHTETLELTYFNDTKIPYYVILSHTWGVEEVSFQEFRAPDAHHQLRSRAGYIKIRNCCSLVASAGFPFVWIDTCCIDKTNSAELSESINSMFRWYREAVECYAYLDDISGNVRFEWSRWFSRGWTLQELLAPSSVVFFDHEWKEIDSKGLLCNKISKQTNIPTSVLLGIEQDEISVAQKMSWAATRETTRVEDRAYSLLGIFGVSMPLIYGEGDKAFRRLQLEIMKTSTDQSIFAWRDVQGWEGVLAKSPLDFTRSTDISCLPSYEVDEYNMTNRGLRITLPIMTLSSEREGRRFQNIIGLLNCGSGSNPARLGLYLEEVSPGQYKRARCEKLYEGLPGEGDVESLQAIYIEDPHSKPFQFSESFESITYSNVFELNYTAAHTVGFRHTRNEPIISERVVESPRYDMIQLLVLPPPIEETAYSFDTVAFEQKNGVGFTVIFCLGFRKALTGLISGISDTAVTTLRTNVHEAQIGRPGSELQYIGNDVCRLRDGTQVRLSIRKGLGFCTGYHGKQVYQVKILIEKPKELQNNQDTNSAGVVDSKKHRLFRI